MCWSFLLNPYLYTIKFKKPWEHLWDRKGSSQLQFNRVCLYLTLKIWKKVIKITSVKLFSPLPLVLSLTPGANLEQPISVRKFSKSCTSSYVSRLSGDAYWNKEHLKKVLKPSEVMISTLNCSVFEFHLVCQSSWNWKRRKTDVSLLHSSFLSKEAASATTR